ncbi:N-acetylmuramoyl-L-alanine amidase [Paenibacillus hodogayensis]|uniref:N-acetylmuramoyl-L-alanine amidase n=1 Tax=Paenibacillus hodogayensis TaxID=279208 RepID=A0ABV5VZJ0_9BACL
MNNNGEQTIHDVRYVRAWQADTKRKGRRGLRPAMLGWAALALLASPFAGGAPAAAADSASSMPPVICLDPGHQLKGNNALEPTGPNSRAMKPKVSSGTQGTATGKAEYVLTLEVSKRIQTELEAMGYTVVMTRETHDVDISNKERAEVANNTGADLFLRIHADGDASSKTQGASVLYPAKAVSVSPEQYGQSEAAARLVLDELVAATGAKSRGTVPRSDLSGFNWSTVPNVLVEMGFMTNAEEDRLLSTDEYQSKMAKGIAEGVNRYITEVAGKSPWLPQPYVGWLDLTDNAYLFDRTDGRLVPIGAYLGPQTVTVREKADDWYRIDTWLGSNWIQLPQGQTLLAAS